jgi:hypothetical protein
LALRGRSAKWKVEVADQLQREMGVSAVWLAKELDWGKPATVRTSLWRFRNVYKVTT